MKLPGHRLMGLVSVLSCFSLNYLRFKGLLG